jgi:hypothetical protein
MSEVASDTDLKALAQAYLDAFSAQDLERCMAFFTEESSVDFNTRYTPDGPRSRHGIRTASRRT